MKHLLHLNIEVHLALFSSSSFPFSSLPSSQLHISESITRNFGTKSLFSLIGNVPGDPHYTRVRLLYSSCSLSPQPFSPSPAFSSSSSSSSFLLPSFPLCRAHSQEESLLFWGRKLLF